MLRKWLPFLLAALCLSGCAAQTSNAAAAPAKLLPRETAAPRLPSLLGLIPEDPIPDFVARLPIEQKAGQLFLARRPETDPTGQAALYQPAGYLLFSRDFTDQTPEALRAALEEERGAAGIPLFFGVDEEGGTVVRASGKPAFRAARFRSPQALYAAGRLDEILRETAEKDAFLHGLGIDVNLAPVADVSTDPADFIYPRTLGQDAQATADYIAAVVRQMRSDGTGSVLKHFPGYGSNADTHTGMAFDRRSLSAFRQADLLPFAAGIDAGADAVLVSHNIVECMDAQHPASLSPAVHRLLREDLGFQGVAVTDDLAMEGVRQAAGDASAAVLAVAAGNDLLITSDLPGDYAAVLSAVQRGELKSTRVDEAVCRVLRWKSALGIWAP